MTPFREVDGWSLLYREKRKPGRKPDNKRRRKWSVPRRKNSRGNVAMITVTAKTQHNFRVKNSHEIILDTVRELLCTGAIWPPRQQHAESDGVNEEIEFPFPNKVAYFFCFVPHFLFRERTKTFFFRKCYKNQKTMGVGKMQPIFLKILMPLLSVCCVRTSWNSLELVRTGHDWLELAMTG